MARIVNPTPRDVLFGRGKPFQSHPGNVYLHKIVNMHKDRYLKSRRYDKLAIAEEIVREIKDGSNGIPGRFLKRADGEDYWVEVSNEVAREKVSHALRGKPRKVPSAAPEAFGNPGKMALSTVPGTTGARTLEMELKALQASRMQFEEQTLPAFNTHRAFLSGGAHHTGEASRTAASPTLQHSLASRSGMHPSEFPLSGMSTLYPNNLDLVASRLAASHQSFNQQRLHMGPGAHAAALRGLPHAFPLNAGLTAMGAAGNMNEAIMPGMDLALARVRAREEAIARIAHNAFPPSDSFLQRGQRGGAAGAFGF